MDHGVVVEKEMQRPRGGKSLYSRDLAGNSVELITPGLWGPAVRLVKPIPEHLKWKDSPMLLEEFKWKQEAIEPTESVLVDFWAAWCGACRAMTPTIEALARDFKVCKVNVDKNQEFAARYGISFIPALLIFHGGQIAARHVNVVPEAMLRAEMQRSSGNH